MDCTELKKLGHRLGHFLRRFHLGIKTAPTREHFRTYVKGQLSDLERKSVAPMALYEGVAPRSLQEFLDIHRWDHDRVRARGRLTTVCASVCTVGVGPSARFCIRWCSVI